MKARHRFLDHIGEVRLSVRAGSFAELVAEAGRALAGLQLGDAPRAAAGPWREVALEAPDREALLVEWLNELIYRAEVEREVATEFEVTDAGDRTLRARFRAVPVPEPPALVKAATLHGARVTATAKGVEADVVLDV